MCGIIAGGVPSYHIKRIDINEDGIIDVCDIQRFVSAIISDNVNTLPDINSDGKIDIKDLQILMRNMGKKQKTFQLRTCILYSSIPKPNYSNNQKIKKVETYNPSNKHNSIYESRKLFILSDRYERKGEGKEKNYSLKLYGKKYLAYHISPKSPPDC